MDREPETIGDLVAQAEARRDRMRAEGRHAAAEEYYRRQMVEIKKLRRRVVAAVLRGAK